MNTLKQLIERLVLDSPDPSLLDSHPINTWTTSVLTDTFPRYLKGVWAPSFASCERA